jgi:hypothetical protein
MNTGAIRRGVSVVALGALMLTLSASSLYAQESTKIPVAHHQTISANPFGLMVEWFNAEYERKLTGSATFGLSGSTTAWGDVDLTNGNLFVRYYPSTMRVPPVWWVDSSLGIAGCLARTAALV